MPFNGFKDRFVRFMNETQLAGFSYIAQSETRKSKAFWILILGGCFIGLCYHGYNAVVDHINAAPTTTYAVYPQSEIKIPDAIVCLDAYFDRLKMDAMSVSAHLGTFMQSFGFAINLKARRIQDSSFLAAVEYQKFQAYHNLSFHEIANNLSFDASDIFFNGCSLARKFTDCARSAQKLWLFPHKGVCFRLASSNQTIEGSSGGLSVRFTTRQNQHYPLRQANFHMEDKVHGATLYLSVEGAIDENPVYLPRLWNTNIGVDLTRKNLVPDGQTRCIRSAHRSNAACMAHCAKKMLSNCLCSPLDFTAVLGQPPSDACSPTELPRCIIGAVRDDPSLFKESLDGEVGLQRLLPCVNKCGVNCDSWSVDKVISGFPVSQSDGNRDIVRFELHHRKMEVVVIEQINEASLANLFGIVGGLLGFWVGGSIVTVASSVSFWFVGDNLLRTRPAIKCKNCLMPARQRMREVTIKLFGAHSTFRRFLRSTLFHGFSYCLRAVSNKQRHFWPTVVGACSVAVVAQVMKSTIGYAYQKPATSYNIFPQQRMVLPAAVVCMPVHFDKRKLKKHKDLSIESIRFLLHVFAMYPTNEYKNLFSMDRMRKLDADFRSYAELHNSTFSEVVNELSFDVDYFFHPYGFNACRYGFVSEKGRSAEACLRRHFWSWMGTCIEFRSGTNYRGMSHGFHATYSPHRTLHFPGLDGVVKDGSYIFLTSDGEMELTPVFVPTGSIVSMSLQPALIKTLPSRENQCINGSSFSYDTCIFRCKVKANIGECKCAPLDTITIDTRNRSVCSPLDVVECRTAARGNSTRQKQSAKAAVATCIVNECRQSCVRFTYRKIMTIIPWTQRRNGYILPASVSFYLSYEITDLLVTEQFYSKTFGDFLAVVGGHIGLWLGGSVVAIVHLLTFWMDAAWTACTTRISRWKRNRLQQQKRDEVDCRSE